MLRMPSSTVSVKVLELAPVPIPSQLESCDFPPARCGCLPGCSRRLRTGMCRPCRSIASRPDGGFSWPEPLPQRLEKLSQPNARSGALLVAEIALSPFCGAFIRDRGVSKASTRVSSPLKT